MRDLLIEEIGLKGVTRDAFFNAYTLYGLLLAQKQKFCSAEEHLVPASYSDAEQIALTIEDGVAKGLSGASLKQESYTAQKHPAGTLGKIRQMAFEEESKKDLEFLIARCPGLFIIGLIAGFLAEDSENSVDDKEKFAVLILMLAVEMALNGHITGSVDFGKQNLRPYQLVIHENARVSYHYASLKTIAPILAMSADLVPILLNTSFQDEKFQEKILHLIEVMIAVVSYHMDDEKFVQDFAELVCVLEQPENKKHFLQRHHLSTKSETLNPEWSENAEIQVVSKIMHSIQEDSSNPYNVWGEAFRWRYPVKDGLINEKGHYSKSFRNPLYTKEKEDNSVDRYLKDSGLYIPLPDKIQVFDDVPVDLSDYPEIYERLLELRGQEVSLPKYADLTMADFFEDLMERRIPHALAFFGPLGLPKDQHHVITKVVADYTQEASRQLLSEFPVLNQMIWQHTTNQKKKR